MGEKSSIFSFLDCINICFLAIFALLLRLWCIEYPSAVVFDEIHFGNFTNWYIQEKYFFDIHPPLAKLIMAGIAKLSQYDGSIEFSKTYPNEYEKDEINYVSLRITPAVFQSFCFPLIYASLRLFSFNRLTSFSGAIILMFDTSIATEGKFILSDGLLHFFSCLTIYSVAHLFRYDNRTNTLICAISLGCAISCKNTALGLLAFVGFVQIVWIFYERPFFGNIIQRASCMLSVSMLILMLCYAIHIIILPYDGMGTQYMPDEIKRTIITNSTYKGQRVDGPSLMKRIATLMAIMHSSNMKINTPHPSESNPIYWPFLFDKYVTFYIRDNIVILCMGSPFVYWPSTASIIISLIFFALRKLNVRHMFFLVGWIVCYYPFFLIPRSIFIYHYIIPLFFAVMLMVTMIESVFPTKISNFLLISLIGIACYGYIYFSSFVYGFQCDNCMDTKIWDERWQNDNKNKLLDEDSNYIPILYGSLPP